MTHRYIVCSTTGYAEAGGSLATGYFVADTFYCYREVARFPVLEGGTSLGMWRRLAAERECDRLNALEETA